MEAFFFFFLDCWWEIVLEQGDARRVRSVNSGGRLISRRVVRTTLSPDSSCKVFHSTGNRNLSKWHSDTRNQQY